MSIRDDEDKLREFNDFLASCKNLKKLTLENFLPSYDPDVHSYKLESLLCFFSEINESEFRVKNFLSPHKETLKILKCFGGWNFVKFAIKKMKVKEIFCDEILLETEEILNTNKSIESLNVSIAIYEREQSEDAHKVIQACKNVKKLKISSYGSSMISRKTLKIASENLLNLKELILPKMTSFIKDLKFESLEILRVCKILSKDEHKSWISLAKCCPNIKKVFVTLKGHSLYPWTNTIPSDDLEELFIACRNFQEFHIKVENSFDITEDFIEAILASKCENFKYLRIECENFDEVAEMAKKFDGTKVRCDVIKRGKVEKEED